MLQNSVRGVRYIQGRMNASNQGKGGKACRDIQATSSDHVVSMASFVQVYSFPSQGVCA